ncbi:polyketide synthase family protein [Frankia casuarinae]|uniref:Acyl transferase region n=1 Tax=Frankia casuarinae (strain DSM 45818 / CECT 9043 / HFP020203 / CcI3) TaxID=106370 RepID=Q2JEB8_FRACC|nr:MULTISPECIES: type I polyketide synthase [Frankia]ABD10374.1 acyl transferase region [Frankia casuarinae]EYT91658.1 polyketide synthase family protein [Frankia casuarinae]KDA41967.1 polyketide synthase family protein [Frankia sp. BMG5.23]
MSKQRKSDDRLPRVSPDLADPIRPVLVEQLTNSDITVTTTDDSANDAPVKKADQTIRADPSKGSGERTRDAGGNTSSAVAVIGIGCRLPGGVGSAASLWDFLRDGRDAVTDVPSERWSEASREASQAETDRNVLWRGGFLSEDVGAFDPEAFGIDPTEAELIDPQHRLLLEVVQEGFEHAGLPTDDLVGSSTAVFVGMSNLDHMLHAHQLPSGGGPYFVPGNQAGPASGRISHVFGLRGPSMTVDTSCSTGLATVYLACNSLRQDECDLAITGAVNLLLSPRTFLAYNELGVLSPTGRCFSFDERADGYVRAEGCVVLVLKRLDDAMRDQDRVLAVLRGVAVNHDGKTSPFTVPSEQAQEEVFRTALSIADVDPEEIGMIEAHGTGTIVGDPIEFRSLAAVYGRGRGRCALGSAKTNFGHAEPAAGMVGLLKAILAVYHGEVPASLHFRRWNPAINPSGTRLFVPTVTTPWPVTGGPRLAAVSSYGVGGTNAHAIVEEPPDSSSPVAPRSSSSSDDSVLTFLLSEGSETALQHSAIRLADWLIRSGATTPLKDIAHTLAVRRSHGPERLAVVARSRDDLVNRLRAYADGTHPRPEGMVNDYVHAEHATGPVWVFSGHGSQWPGMGRDLFATEPVFADTIAALDPLIRAESGFSPEEVLRAGDEVTRIDQVQPLIFVVQVALARTLQSHGIHPAAVVGHSMGEIAAAVIAEALTVEDGIRVICRRSRLCVPIAEARVAAMAVVELDAATVQAEIDHLPDVAVAFFAAPRSTVIGGTRVEVERLVESWTSRDVPAHMINVDVASHCPLIHPVADALTAELSDIRPRQPTIRFYTTVLPDPRQTPTFDAAYWGENMRCPVRAVDATTAIVNDGHQLFQEISPHPVAIHPLILTLQAAGAPEATVVPTTDNRHDQATALRTSIAALHCAGLDMNWRRWHGDGAIADVPPTTWDRRTYLIKLLRNLAPPTDSARSAHTEPTEQRPDTGTDADISAEISQATRDERLKIIRKMIIEILREILSLRARRLSPSAAFSELGLNSLRAVEFRGRIQQIFKVSISLAAIREHPTIAEFSEYIAELL